MCIRDRYQRRVRGLIARTMAKGKRFKNTRLPQAINAEEIEKREKLENQKKAIRKGRRGSDDEDEKDHSDSGSDDLFERSEDEEDEESEEEDEEKVHKAKGVEDFITFEGAGNVNKTKVANVKAKDMKVGEGAPAPELSRRQREEIEARRKKENYDRMTAAGQTDEAKADLARLQEVRKRRAAAAAAKKEEAEREAAEAAAAEQAANAKAQVSASAKLELPPPGVGMKNALLKIKDIMDEDFQKKHNLKNASTNKLAKMKYKEFQKLFEAFDDAASEKQKAEFMELSLIHI
eukprot:TRINITY_DN492_c0_g2_i6.p1 TRINITY_DN492_c0_g2~~TRINITY_DN492_c0_g2_i6.p1  ORF type:complete len:291 (+),score=143.15 TRINITY_DN492_c0_g2_i6:78-950(+)